MRSKCVLWLTCLFLNASGVFSVDLTNFKSCKDSGFCKRQRVYRSAPFLYEVLENSVEIHETSLNATIVNTLTQVQWRLDIVKLTRKSFRLKINERSPMRPRYEIPIGDTLVKEPEEEHMQVTRSEFNNSYVYRMEGGQGEHAILQLKPFRAEFYLNGILLMEVNSRGLLTLEHQRLKTEPREPGEELPVGTTFEEPTDAWEETYKHHKDSKPYGPTSIGVDITFSEFKHVYGLPEHADSLSLKDTTASDPYRLYNLDVFEYDLHSRMGLYGSVPLMWGVNNRSTAGVFWHNPSETFVDVKIVHVLPPAENTPQTQTTQERNRVETHWFSESGVLDVFFILAENPADAFLTYGRLTGITPLPPMFALAYHQCRWNYNDQEDLLSVDENFDKHDLPLDVLWLDIEHTQGKRYFTWDKSKFPKPDEMVDTLHNKSRKLVTVIDPHIKRDERWAFYRKAKENGMFIKNPDGQTDYQGWCWPGSSSWLDFTDPRVRQFWAENFLDYEGGRRPDNTFTWNDMGEPSIFNGPELSLPKDCIHSGRWEHRDLHNLYGMQIHRASWEGHLLRSNNHERPFVLTRAFFAGSQRYGTVWTGDNAGQWDHLKISSAMILSLSISGITFSGADVGGFFGDPEPELMTRWFQAAAFQPFFRAHAHLDTKRREPYLLPNEYMLVIRDAIRQRYQLLPYWYTQFYLSESTNAPVMAPLWYYFPEDRTTMVIEAKYMIGPAILARPVTEESATLANLYFPEGRWYMHHTWQPFDGKQFVGVRVDIHTIPVFYRGGYIIPRRERVRRSSALSRRDPIHLVVCLDAQAGDAHGDLYMDDGHSLNYRTRQEFVHLQFHYTSADNTLRVNNVQPDSHIPEFLRKVKLERVTVVGLPQKPTKAKLLADNDVGTSPRELEMKYDDNNHVLVLRKPEVPIVESWRIQLVMPPQEQVKAEL